MGREAVIDDRRVALLALVRLAGTGPASHDLAARVQACGALAALDEALAGDAGLDDGAQGALFGVADPPDRGVLLRSAAADLARWEDSGVRLVGAGDRDYPIALHGVHDRPAALWVAGSLRASDERSVAVVGTRHPTDAGRRLAGEIALALARAGVTVVSGLAAGIDTVAHETTLAAGGRTIAVIGTGHLHAYPPANARLQRTLAGAHAVLSTLEPPTRPSPDTFRRRNAVMSGLTRATVIVEASVRSGTRVQARHALGHGRAVLLAAGLMTEPWARDLARRPGVHVVGDGADVLALLDRSDDTTLPKH